VPDLALPGDAGPAFPGRGGNSGSRYLPAAVA
jgi:hypothetical protein